MFQSISLPLSCDIRDEYGGWEQLHKDCRRLGCDGVEAIWAGEEVPEDFPRELAVGYHLTFYPDWLDFYRMDQKALCRKYGTMENVARFYGTTDPGMLLDLYREDLRRAVALGAKYVVFHVSDVSIEEGYTYRWLHSDEEVIDASAELVNELLRDAAPTFDFLMENQWWPGLTFTAPEKTARLLDAVKYPRKGLLLDTGHLMNTNPAIRTQKEGLAYIHQMLDRHGERSNLVQGMHLHQSLSGAYVRRNVGALPEGFPEDCIQQFGVSYGHILEIDRHRPWTESAVAELVERVAPQYLTHELAGSGRKAKLAAVKRQITTLQKGGLCREKEVLRRG